MRFICTDPMQTISRIVDIARRLGLDMEELSLRHLGDGKNLIVVHLTAPECHEVSVFLARVLQLVDLTPELVDA